MRALALILLLGLGIPAQAKQPWTEMRETAAAFDKIKPISRSAPAVRAAVFKTSADPEIKFHPAKAALLGSGAGFAYGWYHKAFKVEALYAANARNTGLRAAILNRYTIAGAGIGAVISLGFTVFVNAVSRTVTAATEPLKKDYGIPETRFQR